ncbi:LysR family transcriptional regulator substrate-binding protein [Streptomyces coeruleorubidus]|uniref:LysR family transcriptional regulator substrate-binding protein n=1 Tax=Streptomyces coeruleorubidus TaxID=116188 RepID=UPI0033C0C886
MVRTIAGLAGGRLDIVAPTTLAVDPLADLAGAFRRRHPAIDIVIVEPPNGTATVVADVVRTGECELGLADVRTHGKAVETLELCRQEVLAVVPRSDRFPQVGPVALGEVARMDLVATARGTATRALMDQALGGEGRSPRIAVETVHQAAIVPLVLAGAGATLLPRSLAEEAARRGGAGDPSAPGPAGLADVQAWAALACRTGLHRAGPRGLRPPGGSVADLSTRATAHVDEP